MTALAAIVMGSCSLQAARKVVQYLRDEATVSLIIFMTVLHGPVSNPDAIR